MEAGDSNRYCSSEKRVCAALITPTLLFCITCFAWLYFAKDAKPIGRALSFVLAEQSYESSTYQTIPGNITLNATKDEPEQKDKITCKSAGHERICQYGSIQPSHRYAVYGSTLCVDSHVKYVFDLPLSAKAWHREGFDSIVMIYGELDRCSEVSQVGHVVTTLKSLPYVVLLVIEGINPNNTVTVSQTARMFAPSLIQDPENIDDWQDTYLLTADADIWPMDGEFFTLPPGKDIFHGDISADPVPNVHHEANVPLSFIGMSVKIWVEVMSKHGLFRMPQTSAELINYFAHTYSRDDMEGVTHGGRGWFMDQAMASKRIEEWKRDADNGYDRIHIYQRHFNKDRLDRNIWRPATLTSLEGLVDSHILTNAFTESNWELMEPLINMMYTGEDRNWCNTYTLTFRNISHMC